MSCKKRPFANVELHGRIMNSSTNTPLQATLELYHGARPGENHSIRFADASTNADGTFDIKSKAGWNSDDYYLLIKTTVNGFFSVQAIKYHVSRNQNLDVGNIEY